MATKEPIRVSPGLYRDIQQIGRLAQERARQARGLPEPSLTCRRLVMRHVWFWVQAVAGVTILPFLLLWELSRADSTGFEELCHMMRDGR